MIVILLVLLGGEKKMMKFMMFHPTSGMSPNEHFFLRVDTTNGINHREATNMTTEFGGV